MAENLRAKMPALQRAKQFAPFQSLKGFEDALRKKEKAHLLKQELSEEKEYEINEALISLAKNKKITVTYYNNGEYICFTGLFKRMDLYNRTITVEEIVISIDDIYDLNSQ